MEDFLVNAPLPTLLGLMVLPVSMAVILGGFIVFAFIRRSNKPTNNQQPATSYPEENSPLVPPVTPPAPVPPTEPSPSLSPPSPPEEALDLGPLITPTDAKPQSAHSLKQAQKAMKAKSSNPSQPVDSNSTSGQPVELLRLLRDPQTGQLIVAVGNQQYTKLVDVTDKRIGQFILKLAAHLLAFTNGVIFTEGGTKSVDRPKAGPVPVPPVTPNVTKDSAPQPAKPAVPKAPPEVEAAFLASLQQQTAPASSPELPKKRGFFGRITEPEAPPPALPGLNLAEEINDIVQTRLRYSPLVNSTKIEITADPGGGIRIQVNDQFFASPDDVTDESARELIKAAIKEWEQS